VQQQQQSVPTAQLRQDENVWQIPYSHNYHPHAGSVQNGEHAPTKASKAPLKLPSKAQHPRTGGAVEKEESAPAQADKPHPKPSQKVGNPHTGDVEKEKSAPAKACKSHPEPPKNRESLSEAEMSIPLFPFIKADVEKQFGLTEFEFSKKDVLCGRGATTNNHPGNVRYRSSVDKYRWHYATVKKARKQDVAKVIVKKIREDHGRFLKKEGDRWYEVGDEVAIAKTAQTLREGLAKIYREGLRTKMEGNSDVVQDEDLEKEFENL
jgi:hypothetical protein